MNKSKDSGVTCCVVLITARDTQEAERIAAGLLDKKLIACANILSGVKSMFWWEKKVDTADEVLLILKSREDLFPEVAQTVRSLHSYDVPEIIALPIIRGYNPYLNWISESTEGEKI